VAKGDLIRLLLAIAAKLNWEIHQMDVKSAYLNGNLKEDIYLQEPKGFESGNPGHVWHLLKTLYGLKQSGREWNEMLDTALKYLGFTRCISDYSFYHRKIGDTLTMIAIHVDDMLITCNTISGMAVIKKELCEKFEMQDEGEAKWMLGIEIIRNRKNLSLSITQRRYINDMLERFGMKECVSVSTPMAKDTALGKDQCPKTNQEREEM
jgi:Reverse transcriptase (RNA-dependent DNA polymerase)